MLCSVTLASMRSRVSGKGLWDGRSLRTQRAAEGRGRVGVARDCVGRGGTVQEDQRLMEKNTVPEDTSDSALARGTGVDSLRRPMTASTVEGMRLAMRCFELWNEHTQKKTNPTKGVI